MVYSQFRCSGRSDEVDELFCGEYVLAVDAKADETSVVTKGDCGDD